MDKLRLRSQSGFTLIELLVVVAIIGILAAIAIPQFAAYRRRGFAAAVVSDLRNMAVAQESAFAQNQAYSACATPCVSGTPIGFNRTVTVSVGVTLVPATTSFTMTGAHASCGTDAWAFDSLTGVIGTTAGTGGCI